MKLLEAKYQSVFIRYTASPQARELGQTHWSAGPADEWCESEIAIMPDIRTLAHFRDLPAGLGRIARQKLVHAFGGCRRRAPHWRATGASE